MTLAQRDLNRALLARQGLLDRFPPDLPAALRRIGGIQAQYAPAMYVGLWTRVADLERDAVTRALEDRSAIQATLLRSTIHLVAARDCWPWAAAVRGRTPGGVPARRADAAAAAAMAARRATLRGRARRGADAPARHRGATRKGGRSRRGPVAGPRARPAVGTWERRRADLYGLAEDWLAAGRDLEGRRRSSTW